METFDNFLVNNYPLIKAFHVISMVAWMAAMLYLPRLFVYHTMTKKDSETSKSETIKPDFSIGPITSLMLGV